MPSVLVLGQGPSRTAMMREMTKEEAVPHAKEDDFYVSYHTNGETVQFVAPREGVRHGVVVKKARNMNCKSAVYVFDVSPYSSSIEHQIKNFNTMQNEFDGHLIAVANKAQDHDKNKLRKIKAALNDIHEVSFSQGSGMAKLKNSIKSDMKLRANG